VAKTKYQKNLVTKPIREKSSEPDMIGRVPTMTYVSHKFFPQLNLYSRWGWIVGMPDPNPHVARHTHDYDEIVIHIGNDPNDPEDLGGELEFMVDDEPIVINKTSALYIPKGVPHGPLTWKRVTRPHIEMAIVVGTGDFSKVIPGGYKNPPKKDSPK
jgi:hypothetical protein